ncbi:MAG: sugar phosphate isomerase/epimerase [Planctomycetes bacterium]|jgi:sugar phosphate isomerase/epimerase|nr:sugar phosphate isomerase/epimerase [Planctomycetota bacterium]
MKAQSTRADLSRRSFLATTASAAALTVVGTGCRQEGESRTMAKGGKIPIGLQLYSVRSEAQKDLSGTIAKVAKMGYQGVEFAGYYECKAKDIRKMLDDNGLVCCGTHTAMETLADENLAATIEFNKVLGNTYLIVPWLQPSETNPKETWLGYARRFNVLVEKVKPQGMWVGYHAHQHDFAPLDGTTGWDIIASNTSRDFIMQLDSGNCMDGGGDPVAYLKRYPGRAVTIHLKEHSAKNPKAMIGEGDVKWAEIFQLVRAAGTTRWYIIEEEKDAVPPLQGAKISLNNLKKIRT